MKTKHGIYDFYKQMPPWAKGVTVVVALGVTSFAVYKIYKAIQNFAANSGSRTELDAQKSELHTLNNSPDTAQTISDAQAASMADSLFTAMDGYGTDGVTLQTNLMQVKNQADWLALSKAYGIRTLSSGKLNPEPDFTGTLIASIGNELGVGPEDIIIKGNINGLFQQRGISITI